MSHQPPPGTVAALYWQLVRFGFRLLYNEMAFTYDLVSWGVSLGEWRSWQRAALKHLGIQPGARVLELAHGTANLQIDLRTVGLEPIGIDLSRAMGRIAYRKLRYYRITPRLAQARAQALPFPDEAFAAVVSTFPTEFIVDSATLAEAYRVLKPGGRLVFVPNGQLTGGGLARQGLELAYRITGQRGPWPPEIEERFHTAGFTLSQAVEPGRFSIAQVVIAHKAG
jgi:ubiquinone/menaquinone biosynthesis C-methylase UbiE